MANQFLGSIFQVVIGVVLLATGNPAGLGFIISGVLSAAAIAFMPDQTQATDSKQSSTYGFGNFNNPVKGDTPVYVVYSYRGHKIAPTWVQAFVTPRGYEDQDRPKIIGARGQSLSGMLVCGEGPSVGPSMIQLNGEDLWTRFVDIPVQETPNGSRKVFTLPHKFIQLDSVRIKVNGTSQGWVITNGSAKIATGDGVTSMYSFTLSSGFVESSRIEFYSEDPQRSDHLTFRLTEDGPIFPRVWQVDATRLLINTQGPYPKNDKLFISYALRTTVGFTLTKNDDGFIQLNFTTAPASGTKIIGTFNRINFPGFRWQYRSGSRHQLPVEGFDSIRNTQGVGVTMVRNTDNTVTTRSLVDDIIVDIASGSSGFTQYDSEGGHGNVSAFFRIKIQLATSITGNIYNTAQAIYDPVGGRAGSNPKSADEFEFWGDSPQAQIFDSFSVRQLLQRRADNRPTDATAQKMLADFVRAKYKVIVTRTSVVQSNTSSKTFDDLVFTGIEEVLREFLNYANTSYFTFHGFGGAKAGGSAPNVTMTFSGIANVARWTGSQWVESEDLQSKAVWAAINLITSKRYGCGGVYDRDVNINLASAIVAQDWLDTQVAKSAEDATLETAGVLDIVLDTRKSLMEHVRAMLLPHRIFAVLQGDVWKFVVDDKVHSLTGVPLVYDDTSLGRTAKNSLQLSRESIAQRPTEIQVIFLDEEERWEQKEIWVSERSQSSEPRRIQRVTAYGITRRSEATRYAKFLYNMARVRTPMLVVGVAPQALDWEAGDLFRIISARSGIDGYWRVSKMTFDSRDFFVRVEARPYDINAYDGSGSSTSIIYLPPKTGAGLSAPSASGGAVASMTVTAKRIA